MLEKNIKNSLEQYYMQKSLENTLEKYYRKKYRQQTRKILRTRIILRKHK